MQVQQDFSVAALGSFQRYVHRAEPTAQAGGGGGCRNESHLFHVV